ncbi:hypothetical protein [Imperialibacter sp.]|uniref:hypothetical protein n=1 Tax=Imperialibacter sp. TaxID=2038411 RepID=UPI0032EF38DB
MGALCGQRQYYTKHEHFRPAHTNVMPIPRHEGGIPVVMALKRIRHCIGSRL